ncbi:MAG: hypothetical protein K2N55_11515 [Lachnospiraceae bacterium]|nr:hypothetical protein [Lachnospiraceae bacterium]
MRKRLVAMILSAAFVLGALSGCGAGRNLNGSKDSGNATAETEAPTDESALWNDSADVTDEGYDDGTAGEGYIAKSGAEGASYAESCYRTDEFIENTEEYSKWNEKGFSSVLNQPLSTFAAAVAEFGLLASHSAYPEDASVEHVLSELKGMELEDEYKAEFEDLVRKILLFNRKVVFSFAYE